MSEASIPVDITRMDADGAQSVTDAVAREEPLEIGRLVPLVTPPTVQA